MKLEKEVQLYDYAYDVLDFAEGFTEKEKEILKQMRHRKIKLTLEIQEPILGEAEREYLSGVIRPFKNNIYCIMKVNNQCGEYIEITFKNDERITFPNFVKKSMYKGMELDKEYTLEDLGL